MGVSGGRSDGGLLACLACGLLLAASATLAEVGIEGQPGEQQQQQQPRPAGICAMSGCHCTVKAHHWVFVKCVFADYQDVDLAEGMIPEDTMELDISHCRELRIQSGAFSGGGQLKRVHVSGINTLVANRQAFQNLSAPNPLLEVSECNRVILESHAFKNTKGPLSVAISRCKYVTIKPNAFSWLLHITVREVPNLELSSNAFKFDTPQHGRHGPATKIMFQSVKIPELPTLAFPSTAAEIRMDNLLAETIKKDAFCAMNILSIIISNASISEIEPGAFSDRTLIHSLEFADVKIKAIRTGAFRAGANNLTIQYSRLSEVESGAIDITVASVSFNNNEFHQLHQSAIKFHQWNRITIDSNLFQNLDSDAITAVSTDIAKMPNLEFSFYGNHIEDLKPNSLAFAEISQSVIAAHVGNNYFKRTCNCNLESWIRERVGSNTSISWILDSSYCMVDKLLRNCFNLPEGYLSMRNYTETICSKTNNRINCTNEPNQPEPSVTPPSVGPHQYPRHKGYFDVEMSDPDQLEREKRIIVIVCVVAVFSLVVVILTSGILYMRRRGVCPKLTSNQLSNLTNSWFSPTTGMTAATSARSISRLSVHEYAGLQPETRILDIEAHEEAIVEDEGAAEGGVYTYAENKATQTLPEELTEDYLTDLRERLNDPENYSYARDMIEHLYDLIKVEESCNNNNNDRRPSLDGNYDIIRPKLKRTRSGPGQSCVNVGTKVPSLDKLLPSLMWSKPQIVTDYAQPRDQRILDQNHLYAELPGDETVPSTSRLAPPVLAALAGRAPQPLPPDVVNNHITKINGNSSGVYDYEEVSRHKRPQEMNMLRRPHKRSTNSLKCVGYNFTGSKKMNGKRPNSLFDEYADPSDVTAHLYSELPEPRQQASILSPNKMANRPLPTKPDQQKMPTART